MLNNLTILQYQDPQKDLLIIVAGDLYQMIQKDHRNLHFVRFLSPYQIYFKPFWRAIVWINLDHHSDLDYLFFLRCMNRTGFLKLEDFYFEKDLKNHFTMFFGVEHLLISSIFKISWRDQNLRNSTYDSADEVYSSIFKELIFLVIITPLNSFPNKTNHWV